MYEIICREERERENDVILKSKTKLTIKAIITDSMYKSVLMIYHCLCI